MSEGQNKQAQPLLTPQQQIRLQQLESYVREMRDVQRKDFDK